MSSKPGEGTRERILRVARSLLEKSGGREVKLADIAKAAGVSRQALYLHFPSRTGLMIALVQYIDETHNLDETIARVRSAGDGEEALNQFVTLWTDYLPKISEIARVFYSIKENDDDAAAAWKDRMDLFLQLCQSVVVRLAREGRLNADWTVRGASELMWSMLSIRGWRDLTGDRRWTPAAYRKRIKLALKSIFIKRRTEMNETTSLIAEESIEVERDLSAAFAYVADLNHYADWFPEVAEMKAVDESPPGTPGKAYREKVFLDDSGQPTFIEVKVTQCESDRKIVTEAEFPPLLPRMSISFEARPVDRTRITYKFESRSADEAFLKVALPRIARVLKDRAPAGLRKLKEILERG